MKCHDLALAAVLALGSVAASAATGPLDLSSGSAGFFNTPVAGGFVDNYTFTLTTASIATASVTSVVNGARDVDFTAIFLTGPAGVFSFTQLLADPFETYALNNTTLVAGSYTLTLIGTNTPSLATYGGNIGVTAVPEPQTYALLLAGLAGVAFISRRRSN